ncbi:hypothetical protein [Pedobacter sp. MR2016-24]|uniref:hypothetical protein n=1 Tax=Pedobacter sp. MR2016-24 TaxID=2994466 RepID=UPI00224759A4|nr:hypothetical protein [Pedobacter sp. MR2016-24]MCX2483038.1 hypothetical protein [Pedobacter sp. MR2016-24]
MNEQIIKLFILAIPVACIAWTVTHEEVFREPREYFMSQSVSRKTILGRKFFYLFTCEYCFSHYVVLAMLFITNYHLLFLDWRGYLIAGFSLVWIANLYMSIFGRLRLGIRKERTVIKAMDDESAKKEDHIQT